MPRDLKRHTDFLLGLGTDKVPHTGDDAFMTHLISVYRDLDAWGCEEAVCLGGLYHSIYGTELFQRFALPLDRRGEVRALAGARAERLGYLNSAMDRPSFDAILADHGPRRMRDRFTERNGRFHRPGVRGSVHDPPVRLARTVAARPAVGLSA